MQNIVLAIDIGGTNVKAGLVDRNGVISNVIYRPSKAVEGRDALLSVIKDVIENQCGKTEIAAIGCGTPGAIDHKTGIVNYMQAHIPDYTGTPLAKHLSEFSGGIPAAIDNDVNLIALGENWKGAGKNSKCQVSLALGTGLGGGVVVDGKLFRGSRGRAPEFGHMIAVLGGEPCTCGNFGCYEVYTAPGAMARRAKHYLASGILSVLSECEKITAAEIVHYGNLKDQLCMKILNESTIYLAKLIWNIAQAFDPDVFVIGGGLMKAGDKFLSHLNRELDKFYCPDELDPMYTIKISELGDDAGILGAGKLAWDWLDGIDR
ncbi:ROK family protein [bacterium]|nr:ROK family protein [bacterium]